MLPRWLRVVTVPLVVALIVSAYACLTVDRARVPEGQDDEARAHESQVRLEHALPQVQVTGHSPVASR